jgi:hypothetical protein
MCRIRKNKIEKIDEEDEGNSSMMQSYKSDDKREDGKRRSEAEVLSATKEAKSIERYDRKTVDSATKIKNGVDGPAPPESTTKREFFPKNDDADGRPEVKKRSKSNTNLAPEPSDSSGTAQPTKGFLASRLENGELPAIDKSGEFRAAHKRSGGSARKVEPSSSYKVNSVSLLNMLQNKTLSLIKNVS